jgi:hypothetical protein
MKPYIVVATLVASLSSLYLLFAAQRDKETMAHDVTIDSAVKDSYRLHLSPPSMTTGFDRFVSGRDQKVAEKIDRFRQRTTGITREEVAKERAQIADGLTTALRKKSDLPQIIVSTDEAGNNWEELHYSDGIIRYLPMTEIVALKQARHE